MKVLPPDAMDSVAEHRFRREAELLARLQHPHIVPVLSVGWTRDVAYYVMPFVEGESLAVRLSRDGPLEVDAGVDLIREIADALGHAHSLGVIHRDVKPANILLAAGHAVVTDFGIARIDASHVARLTSTGLGLGTIGYMAPEQIVGASEADGRADVFALGVVGYELLTGRSPFATSGEASILAPQARARPAHPSTIRAGIPKDVGDALLKALEPDPAARFATMREFRDALPKTTHRRGLRGKHWAIVGAVTVAGAALFALLSPRRGNDNEASPLSRVTASVQQTKPQGRAPDQPRGSVIAVAPFDVMRGDLAIWREGMVDVLSRNLDGMGELRTISPTTILQTWRGRSDAVSAARLGKLVRAQVVVYGVLRTNGDSVRAVASLYDMTTNQLIGDVERVDAPSRIDRLADSLTVEIVRALGGPRAGRTPRIGSVGTRSMPALKAFLQGEQYLRRGNSDSAAALFRRATDIDTGFALAYHGLARAHGWTQKYNELVAAEREAAIRNHGLSEHDSLLIVVGALGAEARAAKAHVAEIAAKEMAELKRAMERYPADAELKVVYADLVFHQYFHEIAPTTAAEQIDLFDRAIAADSGLIEGYFHALQLSVVARDTRRLQKYFRAVETGSRSSAQIQSGVEMMRWFVVPNGRGEEDCRRWADTVAFTPQYSTSFRLNISPWVDSAGSIARCLETLATRPSRAEAEARVPRVGVFAAPFVRARGLLSRAEALDPNRASTGAITDYTYLAMEGAFDADSAAARARPFATDPSQAAADMRRSLWLFWVWRKDTVALRAALATERAFRDQRPGFSPEEADRAIDDFHDALFAIVHGDTARALRVIERAPYAPPRIELAVRGWILPTLYERSGRLVQARPLLDRPHWFMTPLQTVLVELHIGRVAERLGDRARAASAYSLVADALHDAEPMFAPFVREALEGLRRTGDTRAVVR